MDNHEIQRLLINESESCPRKISISIESSEDIDLKIELIRNVFINAIKNVDQYNWFEYLPDWFINSFDKWTDDQKKHNSYILDKWEWKYQFEKRNWKWCSYNLKSHFLEINLSHSPRGSYIDVLYLLVAVGFDYRNISVEDELFGNYNLTETNLRV